MNQKTHVDSLHQYRIHEWAFGSANDSCMLPMILSLTTIFLAVCLLAAV
jgi:hypothetical protein